MLHRDRKNELVHGALLLIKLIPKNNFTKLYRETSKNEIDCE